MTKPIVEALRQHAEMMRGLDALVPDIAQVADRMIQCLRKDGTIFWMGNGGSAAESQHLAAELVGRYTRNRSGLASVALTTDTSILTAVANDFGFETVFSRQAEALCRKGDVVVGLSTSGESRNVLLGLRQAKSQGAYTVAMTGTGGGSVGKAADRVLAVPSSVTARIQEAHLLIGHTLCDLIEAGFVAETRDVG